MHKEHPIEKIYFNITEVSSITGESKSAIRFWDDKFRITQKRSTTGHRLFTTKNIDDFLRIGKVKEYLTLKGMKKYLNGKLKIELL